MYDFDSRMNLTSLLKETKEERRSRYRRERREGRRFIDDRCGIASQDYQLGDLRMEVIREANYVARILSRQETAIGPRAFKEWTVILAGRGVHVNANMDSIRRQALGGFKKGDYNHSYYRTTLPALYREVKARNCLAQVDPDFYRRMSKFVDSARRVRWSHQWCTGEMKKMVTPQVVPLLSAFKRFHALSSIFDCLKDNKPNQHALPMKDPSCLHYWRRMLPRRSTHYSESWETLMNSLRKSIVKTRNKAGLSLRHIKPQWFSTRKALIQLKACDLAWQQHTHDKVRPKQRVKLPKYWKAGIDTFKHPKFSAADPVVYKSVYGKDSTGNRSPSLSPLVQAATGNIHSTCGCVRKRVTDAPSACRSSSGSLRPRSDTSGADYSPPGEQNLGSDDSDEDLILKALMMANKESCKRLLDTLDDELSSEASVRKTACSEGFDERSPQVPVHVQEGTSSDAAPINRDGDKGDADADSPKAMLQLMLDTLHKKVCKQIKELERAKLPTEERSATPATSDNGTPPRPRSGKKSKKGKPMKRPLSAKSKRPLSAKPAFKSQAHKPGKIPQSQPDEAHKTKPVEARRSQSEETSGDDIASMLLDCFCSTIYETLREVQSRANVSAHTVVNVLEAAMDLASDEELFANILECICLVTGSGFTSDDSMKIRHSYEGTLEGKKTHQESDSHKTQLPAGLTPQAAVPCDSPNLAVSRSPPISDAASDILYELSEYFDQEGKPYLSAEELRQHFLEWHRRLEAYSPEKALEETRLQDTNQLDTLQKASKEIRQQDINHQTVIDWQKRTDAYSPQTVSQQDRNQFDIGQKASEEIRQQDASHQTVIDWQKRTEAYTYQESTEGEGQEDVNRTDKSSESQSLHASNSEEFSVSTQGLGGRDNEYGAELCDEPSQDSTKHYMTPTQDMAEDHPGKVVDVPFPW